MITVFKGIYIGNSYDIIEKQFIEYLFKHPTNYKMVIMLLKIFTVMRL